MPDVDTSILIGGAVAAFVATTIAGALAFSAHRHAKSLQRLFDAEPALAEAERIEEELETKRRQLSELEQGAAQTRALASRESQLRAEIAALEQQKSQMAALQQQADQLQQKAASAASQIEAAKQEFRQIKSDAAHEREQRQALQAETQRAAQAADEASEKLAALQKEIPTLTAEAAQNRAELAAQSTSRDGLSAEVMQLESRRAEAIAREQDLEALEGRQQRIKEELETTLMKLEAAKQSQQDAEEAMRYAEMRCDSLKQSTDTDGEMATNVIKSRLADVWTPEIARCQTGVGEQTEQACLGNVTAYLKSHGLIFHDRVVYGLHTALKTGNEAPLLVLAGISGTGKSLLPQRYAEAMGINKLVVPVQPRWDGPQDLLGFFNHLEQKFMAQPLTRALAQMHIHADTDKWVDYQLDPEQYESLSDQLLLVLLDEMNLARVEYYFSEFLSRLEIRRELAENATQDDRRAASLEIECGRMPSGMSALRIFPGKNTFFVGTMNEDETTQSLSDKVVDRANIMRFAKPKKMASGPSQTPMPRATTRLSQNTWAEWCQMGDLSQEEALKISDVCERVNTALEAINLPFGHRLLQAVTAYAKFYPSGVVPNRIDCAIADQLEMRILPRLRGVELDDGSEAIDLVRTIAEDCDDTELASAIDEARESRQSSHGDRFHWAGVARSS